LAACAILSGRYDKNLKKLKNLAEKVLPKPN
jgi:hypothetical protein